MTKFIFVTGGVLHAAEPATTAARRARRRASIPRRGASSGTRSTRLPPTVRTVLVSTHYMDEAERCHEIAYIAYGDLLVHGSVEHVIESRASKHYVVSSAEGAGLAKLSDDFLESRASDGGAVRHPPHVSGRGTAKLEAAIEPYRKRKGFDWKRSEPSLEDVFIDLMGKARIISNDYVLPTIVPSRLPGNGFWRKTWAMLAKGFTGLSATACRSP